MSHNQVRADRNDGGQPRKSGGRGRGFYGGGRVGGRGSGVAASLSSNQSYRKSNNEQGGQSRIAPTSVGIEASTPNSTQRVIQNGAPGPSPVGSSTSQMPHDPTNPVDTSSPRSSQAPSKAHPSQSSAILSNSMSPSTPVKVDGDGPKPLPLQFGTISPGIVNGLKIPARTSSAPPNLDEQKQNQVHHNSFKAGPTQPIPSAPKQQPQQTQKETAGNNQFSGGEPRPPVQVKRDMHAQQNMYHPPKPSNIPIPGLSMPIPFHPPPIPLQFGVPGPHQIPVMPIGNAPQIPQQMMFPNIHPHQMPPHLGFGHPISSSPPQLPNPPPYSQFPPNSQFPPHQQHISKFSGARKPSNVKITHPDTHEELRLDKATPQSRPIPSFSSTPYFQPTSFNSPSVYFGNNHPVNMVSQPPSFNQPVGQIGHIPVRSGNVLFGQRVGAPSVTISKPPSKPEHTKVSEKHHAITTDEKEVVPSKSLESLLKEAGKAEAKPKQIEVVDKSNSGARLKSSVNLTEDVNLEDVTTKQVAESSIIAHDTDSLPISTEESTVCPTANVSSQCTINESVELENGKSAVSDLSTVDSSHVIDTPIEVSETIKPVLPVNKESSVEKNYIDTQNSERVAVSSEATILEPQKSDLEEKPGNDVGSFSPKGSNHELVILEETKPNALASETKPMATKEPAKAKPISGKKKKMKDILSKADATRTSDLYNAYKSPDEKQKHPDTSEIISTSPKVDKNNTNTGRTDNDCSIETEEGNQCKDEIDDWEDAEEMPTPKLDNGKIINDTIKKYTRDFLLTFSEQYVDLPLGFEIASDIAAALLSCHGSGQNPYPSPGKSMDRSPGFSRSDRRGYGMADEAKWKQSGNFNLQNIANQNFRPVQNANYGDLRKPYVQPVNQHGQPVNQYGQPVNQYGQPLLSVPMQSMISQGGQIRYNSDADRWHSTFGAKGMMSPPQTPLQVMHKAEKKYEVGKVSDEEQAKQRQLKGILNKLTPQNFERLFQQVNDVNIDNIKTLSGVISQIFDKALMEPTFCEMYADFCYHLSAVLPDFAENEEKISFKRLLLNKCQEEFESGDLEAEALRVEEGENKQTDEEREGRRIKNRRRTLGNIRLIGELYKKKMLTERIMHECIQKLLGELQTPDEEDLEALCKLMSTIGDQIDHPKAKNFMDAYFVRMQELSTNQKLSSRIRFMIRDVIDLRKNRWQERRKVDGPKKIEEVHRDAARERQSQTNRLTRGASMGSSSRRVQDYNSRGSSVLPSPTSNRGMPPQHHGYGNQEARYEDRHSLENRTLSYPLSQRPTDDPITLGPQGGLARGMSKGHPSMPSGPNMYNVTPDRAAAHNSRENSMPRYVPGKAPLFTTSPVQAQRPAGGMASDAKTMSEEVLREKSIAIIKEFYSAKDEKEVAMCIKELNSSDFYPSMLSLWVTDSFERKDMERGLLATLLVNLCRSQDNLLSQAQLSQGFESVLSTLEDAVNDAPRAAEFLGRIFAKIILENVLPSEEIAKLIYGGGEEPGSLLESGLASEVLGTVLEVIKTEKGDSVVKDILTTSDLKLEDFKPPHPIKSKKLDAFL